MIEEIGGAKLKKSDFIGINECFKPIEREYKRGEIITTYSPENDTICIIKEGTVYLTTDNAENQRRIISFYEKGDIIVTCIVPSAWIGTVKHIEDNSLVCWVLKIALRWRCPRCFS